MASVPFLDLPAEIPWHIAPHLTHREGAMMTIVAVGAGPWRQIARCPKIASTRSERLTDVCQDHDDIAHLHGHSHRLAVDILQCGCCFRWTCDLCFAATGQWCPGDRRTNSQPCEDSNPLCRDCSDPEATTLVSVRIASTTPLQSTESTYKTTNGGYRSEPAQRGPLLHDVGH